MSENRSMQSVYTMDSNNAPYNPNHTNNNNSSNSNGNSRYALIHFVQTLL